MSSDAQSISVFAALQKRPLPQARNSPQRAAPDAFHTAANTAPGYWPNLSLNRTFCGSPGLGLKILAQTRPTAKCRLAQTLGLAGTASDPPHPKPTPRGKQNSPGVAFTSFLCYERQRKSAKRHLRRCRKESSKSEARCRVQGVPSRCCERRQAGLHMPRRRSPNPF